MNWQDFKQGTEERDGLAFEVYVAIASLETDMDQLGRKLNGHLEYLRGLEADGVLVMAGPLSSDDGEEMAGGGLVVLRARSYEEAYEIASKDPLAVAGIRTFTLHRWLMNEGRLDLGIDLSSQSVRFR